MLYRSIQIKFFIPLTYQHSTNIDTMTHSQEVRPRGNVRTRVSPCNHARTPKRLAHEAHVMAARALFFFHFYLFFHFYFFIPLILYPFIKFLLFSPFNSFSFFLYYYFYYSFLPYIGREKIYTKTFSLIISLSLFF